jgi:hypothetical protein
MKNLRMISGITHQVEDEEAENIKLMWAEDSKKPILLRNNTMINPACIESIGDTVPEELEAYYNGNKMNKDRTRVFVDGEWKLFAGNPKDIRFNKSTNLLK